jgi:16S rRNA (uracil1498-N3)-methyltransferase
LTSHRFFIKGKTHGSNRIFLDGKEHHHLSKVARIKPGEQVWLFDEGGRQYAADVEAIEKERTSLLIIGTEQEQENTVRITLAQVLLKGKKMDLVIQKATELGIHFIIPVISDRTVVKIEDKQKKKIERWKRIMIDASKQCGRSSVPGICPPERLDDFINKSEAPKKLCLSERGGKPLREILMYPLIKRMKIPASIILLVGPEGGWTDKEELDIMKNSFEAVTLGSLTLRAETAAIVALAMVSHFWKNEDVS